MRKKKTRLEYRLFILPSYNEVAKKWITHFRLETVEEFGAFHYEIAVEDRITERKIDWKIRGLRSPAISLPNFGPASFIKNYESLRGQYEFVIRKLDGTENDFFLEIEGQKAFVSRAPRKRFIEIVTLPEEFRLGL